jgi:hypothetical protein
MIKYVALKKGDRPGAEEGTRAADWVREGPERSPERGDFLERFRSVRLPGPGHSAGPPRFGNRAIFPGPVRAPIRLLDR